MEENFATRLKYFIDTIKVPTTTVADLCDIPRPSFSQLLSGRNQKVSDVLIRKIHKAYPDLSVMWLMFGEGPMLNSEQNPSEQPKDNDVKKTPEHIQENQESPNIGKDAFEFSNVGGLTQHQTIPNNNIIQQLEENKKILELQLQIEKMRNNPRRVTHITVYYDDLTYESFVPEK